MPTRTGPSRASLRPSARRRARVRRGPPRRPPASRSPSSCSRQASRRALRRSTPSRHAALGAPALSDTIFITISRRRRGDPVRYPAAAPSVRRSPGPTRARRRLSTEIVAFSPALGYVVDVALASHHRGRAKESAAPMKKAAIPASAAEPARRAELSRPRRADPGPAARARALRRRHADRQSRRRHAARSRGARRGRRHPRRGHPRFAHILLSHYGIETPLAPYHEHNAAEARPRALRRMAEGQALALISDAGTPLISDPGYKLVAESIAAGLAGHGRARRLGGARGPLRRRPADRPLLLRRVPAAEERRAPGAHQRAGERARHARLLRGAEAARRVARRSRARTRRRGPRPSRAS